MTLTEEDPAWSELADWAASGLLWLTGHRDGAPVMGRAMVFHELRRCCERLAADASALGASPRPVDLATVLTGRAATAGLERRGRESASGTCHLLRARDAWVAVNLSRRDDVEMLPALLERPVSDDPLGLLRGAFTERDARDLCERGRLLGMPIAELGSEARPGVLRPPVVARPHGERRLCGLAGSLVVDLSAMWAGPLCAKLLGDLGAGVVKVESTSRPDGLRHAQPTFYEWLHGGHRLVALDFASHEGVGVLRSLVDAADIVIEASRPRALGALGVEPAVMLARKPGKVWLSITGYGRDDGAGGDGLAGGSARVAFGDDAAVAGGLVACDARGEPVFIGDALADPASGLFAAAGVVSSLRRGGGELVDVSMAAVAASLGRNQAAPIEVELVSDSSGGWIAETKRSRSGHGRDAGSASAVRRRVVVSPPAQLPDVASRQSEDGSGFAPFCSRSFSPRESDPAPPFVHSSSRPDSSA